MNICLRNRYELQKELDKGGMSQIYLAKDTIADHLVAVKQVEVQDEKFEMEMKKRLQREYSFLSLIDHPNIIKSVDFFSENGLMYLVLEYVEGTALDYILQEQQSISLENLIALASQIAQAVQVLNAAGIIHRDIKPSNIIIDVDNRQAKLLDLGVGKSLSNDVSQLTVEGTIVGTIDYMSPEQTAGFPAETTDIFSLGITFYQLFSWQAHSPFAGGEIAEIAQRIQTYKLPLLIKTIPDLDPIYKKVYKKLSKMIAHMLVKKPHKRLSLEKVINELISIHKLIDSNINNQWPTCTPLKKEQLQKFHSIGEKFGRDF